MKKFSIIYLVVFLMGFVSCSSDEDNFESRLIGVWYDKYSSVAPNNGFILNADHTGATFYKDSSWDFHWNLEGKTLTIKHNLGYEGLDKSGLVIFSSNNTIMWASGTYTSDPNDCDISSGGGSNDKPSSGNAPSSLTSKTLNLYKSDNSYWIGIVHSSGGSCMVDLYNDAMVSASYPPKYSYSSNGSKATYSLTFTTQTYVPLYGTFTYSQFVENITLQFSSSSIGTYRGTQTNMNGDSKQISGNFTIK